MIPVTEQPEPVAPDFDFRHEVYEHGEDTIRQLAGLPPLRVWPGEGITPRVDDIGKVTHTMLREYPRWTKAMPALHRAYQGRCAYLARYIEWVEVPTTDHFVALRNTSDLMLAYTWSNYRLAHGLMNGRKTSSLAVVDPFEVQDGWFALDLGSFKTVLGPSAPDGLKTKLVDTIRLLGLDRYEVCETRRRAAMKYLNPPLGKKPVPLWSLELDEPFVAGELRRQHRLREEDVTIT